jgi:hypothetical protein
MKGQDLAMSSIRGLEKAQIVLRRSTIELPNHN